MKKQITIFISLFISLSIFAQSRKIPISVPCTVQETMKIAGKLYPPNGIFYPKETGLSKTQTDEVFKKLDAIHKLIVETFPSLFGGDAVCTRSLTKGFFANLVKYVKNPNDPDRTDEEVVTERPLVTFKYTCNYHMYFCARPNEIWSSETGDPTSWVEIYANDFGVFQSFSPHIEDAEIDGLPILEKKTAIAKWKGYDLCTIGGPAFAMHGIRAVLLHREGEMPYIPVTRKQYLDRLIIHLKKFYDNMIGTTDQISEPEQKRHAREIYEKEKVNALKKAQDELDKTTKDGLLDATAIIASEIFSTDVENIFIPEVQGGAMLVTENPNYMHKDLPKNVPQFFVLYWDCGDNPCDAFFRRMIEENFPIEKLQAMIDK
jgi:hypothetical protein